MAPELPSAGDRHLSHEHRADRDRWEFGCGSGELGEVSTDIPYDWYPGHLDLGLL
jgi:hypothetical protein